MGLKLCPFCKDGGKPTLIRVNSRYASSDKALADEWKVMCSVCHIGTPVFYDKIYRDENGGLIIAEDGIKKATDLWNGRCSDARQDD